MATTHTARTVHHTVSEDGPPAPGAGNVRTQRATCGTRVGAISTSTTAVPAAAPGSPVRVRATHATANPSSTLPASARPAAAQGSASPRSGRRQQHQRAGGERGQQRHGADPGAPDGPGRRHVDDQAGRLVEGERRGRGEQREADREQHGGGGRERGPAAAHHDRHAADARDRRPRPGPQHRSGHHAVTAWVNPPGAASTSKISGRHSRDAEGADDPGAHPPLGPAQQRHQDRDRAQGELPADEEPRRPAPGRDAAGVRRWSVKKANGANSRSTATGAESGCDMARIVTRFTQPKRTRNSTNAAPGNRTQRPSATPSSGPPSDGTTICPTRTATRADGLNGP